MNRDYLLRAFERERRERALGLRHRHAHRPRKYPQWLSYAPTRPVGRREAPDSAWMDVVAVALSMAALAGCAWLAGAMPR